MCICFIRCGIKVTLFHMQTPKAYFIHAPLWCILGVIH